MTAPHAAKKLEMPYRWNGVEGNVQVEVGVNDDPAARGCSELARGFPYCRATIEPPSVGYADSLGWVQLVRHDEENFVLDFYEALGEIPHPFAFFGLAPTFEDAPHGDPEDWHFLAHTFLCGLGGELLEFRHEARAVLGFQWGFSKRGRRIEVFGPEALSAEDWNSHLEHMAEQRPEWSFRPGFSQHPLDP